MSLTDKILLGAIGGLVVALPFLKIKDSKNINYCETLVNQCISKASGEDGVLDFAESVKMARGLGYNGIIQPEDSINLSIFTGMLAEKHDFAELRVYDPKQQINIISPKNNNRGQMCIPTERLEHYLNSKS